MNEITDLCKAFYFRHQGHSLSARQATQTCIHENIFDAGEFHVESGAEFQQGSDPATVPHIPVCRFQCAGDELKKGGFAAAIWADYSCCRARFDFKVEVAQRPKFTVTLPPSARKSLFQAIARTIVNSILLREILDAQRYCHFRFMAR